MIFNISEYLEELNKIDDITVFFLLIHQYVAVSNLSNLALATLSIKR